MRRSSSLLRLGALLLCLALLTGCAGPDGISGANRPQAGDTTATEAPRETSPKQTEAVDGDASAAGTNFGLAYYPDGGFNPYTCTKLANRAVMSLLYQRLFVVGSDYTIKTDLVKSYEFSGDLRSLTMELNHVTFTDGTAVTSQDVVASLQAAAADGSIYGSRFFHVTDLEATDTYTVTVYTDTPYEMLPMLLDVPIVRAADVTAAQPMGSGPYALRGSGEAMHLERKMGYSGPIALSQKSITLYTVDSTTEIRDDFEFRSINLSYTDPGSASYVDYRSDCELYEVPAGIMLYLGCNCESGLFTDETVRAALTYAVNREDLLADPYNGFAQAATLPADPSSPFYDQALAAGYAYAPEKFKSVIKAKALTGTEISLLVIGDSTYRVQAADKIARDLTAAGLKVTINTLTGSSYENALIAWDYDLHLGETRLSANYDLSQFFRPWGDLCYGGMSDSVLYDACLDALENSGNYYNFHQAIAKDGRLVPLLFRGYAVYVNRGSLPDLNPGIDCIFHYDTAVSVTPEIVTTLPPEATAPETTPMPTEDIIRPTEVPKTEVE